MASEREKRGLPPPIDRGSRGLEPDKANSGSVEARLSTAAAAGSVRQGDYEAVAARYPRFRSMSGGWATMTLQDIREATEKYLEEEVTKTFSVAKAQAAQIHKSYAAAMKALKEEGKAINARLDDAIARNAPADEIAAIELAYKNKYREFRDIWIDEEKEQSELFQPWLNAVFRSLCVHFAFEKAFEPEKKVELADYGKAFTKHVAVQALEKHVKERFEEWAVENLEEWVLKKGAKKVYNLFGGTIIGVGVDIGVDWIVGSRPIEGYFAVRYSSEGFESEHHSIRRHYPGMLDVSPEL